MIPQLVDELERIGRKDIIVFAGGVIPQQDYNYLFEKGIAAVFGPGTKIPSCAKIILHKLVENQPSN
ncbi:Methylmalonyl-CoA mutase [compost metagenome]